MGKMKYGKNNMEFASNIVKIGIAIIIGIVIYTVVKGILDFEKNPAKYKYILYFTCL